MSDEGQSWHGSCKDSGVINQLSARGYAMSTTQMSRTMFQKATCMLLSLIIVSVSLAAGALGTERAMQQEYSVTITQLS